MRKKEHDFLIWTSPPSSIKLTSDEARGSWHGHWFVVKPVTPGATLTAQINVKQQDVITGEPGQVVIQAHDTIEAKWIEILRLRHPEGTYKWITEEGSTIVPVNIDMIRIALSGGGTTNPELPAITWIDDLRIYQNGTQIYEETFSDWTPIIGAGVGAVIGGLTGEALKPIGPISPLIGVAIGAAIGAGIGVSATQPTTISTVTIPQIGTTPETTYIITPPRTIAVK